MKLKNKDGPWNTEADGSFDCIHVQYAWTLPAVQEMYANSVRDGKVKE